MGFSLPFITDWHFYAIAIPAVLLLGLSKSGFGATSLALLPFAPLGVWVGVRIARRIQPALFYRLVYLGMFLTGTKLVWDALK